MELKINFFDQSKIYNTQNIGNKRPRNYYKNNNANNKNKIKNLNHITNNNNTNNYNNCNSYNESFNKNTKQNNNIPQCSWDPNIKYNNLDEINNSFNNYNNKIKQKNDGPHFNWIEEKIDNDSDEYNIDNENEENEDKFISNKKLKLNNNENSDNNYKLSEIDDWGNFPKNKNYEDNWDNWGKNSNTINLNNNNNSGTINGTRNEINTKTDDENESGHNFKRDNDNKDNIDYSFGIKYNQDSTDLYYIILQFDFYNKESNQYKQPMTPLDNYENKTSYKEIWKNNFVIELRNNLINAKEASGTNKTIYSDYQFKITDIQNHLDKLTRLKINQITLKTNNDKINGSILFIYKSPEDKKAINIKEFELQGTKKEYFLGILEKQNKNNLYIYVLKSDFYWLKDQINIKFDKKTNFSSDIIYGIIFNNINSSIREYNAICSVDYDKYPYILNPEKYKNSFINDTHENADFLLSHNEESTEAKFLKILENKNILNKDQFYILKDLYINSHKLLWLIQGPPGTGKTTLLLCIISYILLNKNSKILICTQSNSAIEEICERIETRGLFDEKGNIYKDPNIFLLSKTKKEKTEEKNSQEDQKNFNLKELTSNLSAKEKENQFFNNNKKTKKIYPVKFYGKSKYQSTRILCSTINTSGSDIINKKDLSFDYLIVDEAAQATEPSLLVALKHNIKKVILIGDHIQLRPFTSSNQTINTTTNYNKSLFERLIKNNLEFTLLTEQYRMKENICNFISNEFYQNKLFTNKNINNKFKNQKIFDIIKEEKNFVFFDLKNGFEEHPKDENNKSYINIKEFEFCFDLIKSIYKNIFIKINNIKKQNLKDLDNYYHLFNIDIGIISPYKGQVSIMDKYKKNDEFINKYFLSDKIEVNTIDSYQGKEKDIIILTLIRSKLNGNNLINNNSVNNEINNLGFLNEINRLNVALSRAKACLYIIGNSNTLNKNEIIKRLIENRQKENCYYEIKEEDNNLNYIQNILH